MGHRTDTDVFENTVLPLPRTGRAKCYYGDTVGMCGTCDVHFTGRARRGVDSSG